MGRLDRLYSEDDSNDAFRDKSEYDPRPRLFG